MNKKLDLFIKKFCVQKWDQGCEAEVAQHSGTSVIQQGSTCPVAFSLR